MQHCVVMVKAGYGQATKETLTLHHSRTTFNPFPNKPRFLRVCSTRLMKTLGKEEIAHNEQFLLFPKCFLPV